MVAEAKKILDVLRDNGINPEIEGADVESPELPDVGEVVEGERIYTASLTRYSRSIWKTKALTKQTQDCVSG